MQVFQAETDEARRGAADCNDLQATLRFDPQVSSQRVKVKREAGGNPAQDRCCVRRESGCSTAVPGGKEVSICSSREPEDLPAITDFVQYASVSGG